MNMIFWYMNGFEYAGTGHQDRSDFRCGNHAAHAQRNHSTLSYFSSRLHDIYW